jgi:hypothetical protein
MHTSRPFAAAAAAIAMVLAAAAGGCNDHSLSLTLTPNPLVIGLVDTSATVHAHVVAKGFGHIPLTSVQFAVFNSSDSMLASQTQQVDQNMPASPFGFVVDKDYTFPMNGAAVALSGTKYLLVKILDPSGNVLSQTRLDIVVHALKDLPIPNVVQGAGATPTP